MSVITIDLVYALVINDKTGAQSDLPPFLPRNFLQRGLAVDAARRCVAAARSAGLLLVVVRVHHGVQLLGRHLGGRVCGVAHRFV